MVFSVNWARKHILSAFSEALASMACWSKMSQHYHFGQWGTPLEQPGKIPITQPIFCSLLHQPRDEWAVWGQETSIL